MAPSTTNTGNGNNSGNSNLSFNIAGIVNWVLTTGALTIGGWAISAHNENVRELSELRRELAVMKTAFEDHQKQTSQDEHRDRSLQKHWRLHCWERDEIEEIRRKVDLPPTKWPDLPQ